MRDALHFLLINYIVHFLVLMTFEACLPSPVSLVICTTICRVWEAWQKKYFLLRKNSLVSTNFQETLYVFYAVSTRHPSMSGRCYLHIKIWFCQAHKLLTC